MDQKNINKILEEISEIEKKKAQAELILSQIKEEEAELAKMLEEAGVTEDTLEKEIEKLSLQVEVEMTNIRNLVGGGL